MESEVAKSSESGCSPFPAWTSNSDIMTYFKTNVGEPAIKRCLTDFVLAYWYSAFYVINKQDTTPLTSSSSLNSNNFRNVLYGNTPGTDAIDLHWLNNSVNNNITPNNMITTRDYLIIGPPTGTGTTPTPTMELGNTVWNTMYKQIGENSTLANFLFSEDIDNLWESDDAALIQYNIIGHSDNNSSNNYLDTDTILGNQYYFTNPAPDNPEDDPTPAADPNYLKLMPGGRAMLNMPYLSIKNLSQVTEEAVPQVTLDIFVPKYLNIVKYFGSQPTTYPIDPITVFDAYEKTSPPTSDASINLVNMLMHFVNNFFTTNYSVRVESLSTGCPTNDSFSNTCSISFNLNDISYEKVYANLSEDSSDPYQLGYNVTITLPQSYGNVQQTFPITFMMYMLYEQSSYVSGTVYNNYILSLSNTNMLNCYFQQIASKGENKYTVAYDRNLKFVENEYGDNCSDCQNLEGINPAYYNKNIDINVSYGDLWPAQVVNNYVSDYPLSGQVSFVTSTLANDIIAKVDANTPEGKTCLCNLGIYEEGVSCLDGYPTSDSGTPCSLVIPASNNFNVYCPSNNTLSGCKNAKKGKAGCEQCDYIRWVLTNATTNWSQNPYANPYYIDSDQNTTFNFQKFIDLCGDIYVFDSNKIWITYSILGASCAVGALIILMGVGIALRYNQNLFV